MVWRTRVYNRKNKGYNANVLNALNVMHNTQLTNLLIKHSKKEEHFEVNFNKKIFSKKVLSTQRCRLNKL